MACHGEEPLEFMKRIIAKNKENCQLYQPLGINNYLKAKCANTHRWSEFYHLNSLPKMLNLGYDGVGGRFNRAGTYIYLWLIHVDVWQKPTQYYKAIILQLKINKLKKIYIYIYIYLTLKKKKVTQDQTTR